ncbi:TB2/DP1, HVA22 family-domain-containing protein [Obelidium mucronatum]|nr:TB2/DP1, HVA22 family-domain-containing protein [Obelidium mucronatum]
MGASETSRNPNSLLVKPVDERADAAKLPPGLLSFIPQLLADGNKELAKIDNSLHQAPIIVEIAYLTKLRHVYVLAYVIVAVLYVILVAANIFGGFLTYCLAIGWPIIQSLRAAKECKKESVQQWLSYWIILALFTLVEYGGNRLLSLFPFYYFIKLVFILWLIIPYFRGSLIIYNVLLENILPLISESAKPEQTTDSKAEIVVKRKEHRMMKNDFIGLIA